jgi:hypothetical protein
MFACVAVKKKTGITDMAMVAVNMTMVLSSQRYCYILELFG